MGLIYIEFFILSSKSTFVAIFVNAKVYILYRKLSNLRSSITSMFAVPNHFSIDTKTVAVNENINQVYQSDL